MSSPAFEQLQYPLVMCKESCMAYMPHCEGNSATATPFSLLIM